MIPIIHPPSVSVPSLTLKLLCVDIDEQVLQFARPGVTIIIGDQGKPEFWQDFKSKYPVADIFIDDGGHYKLNYVFFFLVTDEPLPSGHIITY